MAITVAASVTGVLDPNERIVAIQTIVRANKAGRVPPLPFDSNATIKTSYEALLTDAVNSTHIANLASAVDQTGLELAGFTEEQRIRVRKALIAGAQSGKGPEALVSAVEKL